MDSEQLKKMKNNFRLQNMTIERAERTLNPENARDRFNHICQGLNTLVEYVESLEKRIEELEKK